MNKFQSESFIKEVPMKWYFEQTERTKSEEFIKRMRNENSKYEQASLKTSKKLPSYI